MGSPDYSAKIIADSSHAGKRLTTFQVCYWRAIHGEVMTHRVFSRNAMSSRAVPVTKMLEQVLRYPAEPIFWGTNKPGMQAGEEMSPLTKGEAIGEWSRAAVSAAAHAKRLSDLGAHKQVANRLLEPFQWMHTIITATEWDNFWELRCHKDAMPEFQHLAELMRKEYLNNWAEGKVKELELGQWHLPYVLEAEYHLPVSTLVKLSTARCARVSFNNHDGTSPIIDKDVKLHDDLVAGDPVHASPSEHQGTPYPIPVPKGWNLQDALDDMTANAYAHHVSRWGNFQGWGQYRKYIEQRIQVQ